MSKNRSQIASTLELLELEPQILPLKNSVLYVNNLSLKAKCMHSKFLMNIKGNVLHNS